MRARLATRPRLSRTTTFTAFRLRATSITPPQPATPAPAAGDDVEPASAWVGLEFGAGAGRDGARLAAAVGFQRAVIGRVGGFDLAQVGGFLLITVGAQIPPGRLMPPTRALSA